MHTAFRTLCLVAMLVHILLLGCAPQNTTVTIAAQHLTTPSTGDLLVAADLNGQFAEQQPRFVPGYNAAEFSFALRLPPESDGLLDVAVAQLTQGSCLGRRDSIQLKVTPQDRFLEQALLLQEPQEGVPGLQFNAAPACITDDRAPLLASVSPAMIYLDSAGSDESNRLLDIYGWHLGPDVIIELGGQPAEIVTRHSLVHVTVRAPTWVVRTKSVTVTVRNPDGRNAERSDLLWLVSSPVFSGTSLQASSVVDLAVGDWNRDGWPDIAVLQSTAGSDIRVFVGQGQGNFSGIGQPISPNLPLDSWANLLSGDFDGDGVPDLLLAHSAGGQLWREQSGAWSFEPLPGPCSGPALALDVDQDGRLDLAVSDASRRTLFVRRSLGGGLFSDGGSGLAVAPPLSMVAAGTRDASQNSGLHLGLDGAANGTFKTLMKAASTPDGAIYRPPQSGLVDPLALGFEAVGLTNADFKMGGISRVLRRNGGLWSLDWPLLKSIQSDARGAVARSPVVAVDLTGEGKPELLTLDLSSSAPALQILFDLTYPSSDPTLWSAGFKLARIPLPAPTSGSSGFLQVSDLDRDGRLDVVVAVTNGAAQAKTLHVLLNRTP